MRTRRDGLLSSRVVGIRRGARPDALYPIPNLARYDRLLFALADRVLVFHFADVGVILQNTADVGRIPFFSLFGLFPLLVIRQNQMCAKLRTLPRTVKIAAPRTLRLRRTAQTPIIIYRSPCEANFGKTYSAKIPPERH